MLLTQMSDAEKFMALEAELKVHREHIRALISLIPNDRLLHGAILGATRRINEEAASHQGEWGKHLLQANKLLDALGVRTILKAPPASPHKR